MIFRLPKERVGRVLLVDEPHERQVLGRLRGRLVVQGRAVQPDQLALPTDAQLGVIPVDQRPPGVSRGRQIFFHPVEFDLESPDLLE
ncbi:MAG: hypothetical protein K2V38_17405, partial [Gemmataceae bacterium]|nr:hypothetical protein [Gemmataceae bacterium]